MKRRQAFLGFDSLPGLQNSSAKPEMKNGYRSTAMYILRFLCVEVCLSSDTKMECNAVSVTVKIGTLDSMILRNMLL